MRARSAFLAVAAAALVACGGGGSTVAQPTPLPTATPTPSPTGTPIATTSSLWVANDSTRPDTSFNGSFVEVFAPGANGFANPTRTINVGQVFGTNPVSVAVDNAGNAYIGITFGQLEIVSPTSCGNGCAGSSFTSTGNASNVWAVALDSANCLYASAGTGIAVFSNGTKQSTLALASPDTINGIAIDPADTVYAVNSNTDTANSAPPSITKLQGTKCGGQILQSTISGSNTQLQKPAQIVLDAQGNIYVSDPGSVAVYVFAAGSSGNVAPIRTISGINTGFKKPWGVAIDATGVLDVSDPTANAVFEFAPGANGNVAPRTTVLGPNVVPAGGGFAGPLGISAR